MLLVLSECCSTHLHTRLHFPSPDTSPNLLAWCSTYLHACLHFTSPDASPQPIGVVFYPSARLSMLPIPGYLLETCWCGALSIHTPVYAPHLWTTSSPTRCMVFYPSTCLSMLPIPGYLSPNLSVWYSTRSHGPLHFPSPDTSPQPAGVGSTHLNAHLCFPSQVSFLPPLGVVFYPFAHPSSLSAQIAYLNLTKELFKRFLRASPSVSLWNM